jgi:hypothetical protein
MNLSKFFGVTAATAAVVGAMGLAYAQTSTDPNRATESPPAASPSVPSTAPSDTTNRPADRGTTTTPAPRGSMDTNRSPSAATPGATMDSGTAGERVARADRN